jgi:hypothetical protein
MSSTVGHVPKYKLSGARAIPSGIGVSDVLFEEMNKTKVFHGWYPTSDERGTIDILWSCLFAIFLCTWTGLDLNLPASDEAWVKFVLLKGKWFNLTLLRLEFLVWLAIRQRYEAKDSMNKVQNKGS